MSRKSGFTLIELLVVVTIMGLTIGGAFVGYRTFNTRQAVITTGKEFMVALRQAQSQASSGTKNKSGCNTTPLVGHRIQVSAGSLTQYSVYEVYQSACDGNTTHLMKTVPLPRGVSFSGAFTITFGGLGGQVTLSGASPLTIRMCSNNCAGGAGALNYSITVSSVGSIQDLGTS